MYREQNLFSSFNFCMLNRDIFSHVSCFCRRFKSGGLRVSNFVLFCLFPPTKAYTYACCHVVFFFFSFTSILFKFPLAFLLSESSILSLFLSCSLLNSFCIISSSNGKNFSEAEVTSYSCTNNFIMLLSYV